MMALSCGKDFECLVEKIDGNKKNLENSSTTKQVPLGFPILQYGHLKAQKKA